MEAQTYSTKILLLLQNSHKSKQSNCYGGLFIKKSAGIVFLFTACEWESTDHIKSQTTLQKHPAANLGSYQTFMMRLFENN